MRIRTIKPEVLDDPVAAHLSSDAWRLWVSTWVLADDAGNLPAPRRLLETRVFWAYERPPDVDLLLSELATSKGEDGKGLVFLYEVRGQRYLHITGFRSHQKINRPSGPKYPRPDDPSAVAITQLSGQSSVSHHLNPSEGSPRDRDHDHDRDHDRDHETCTPRGGKASKSKTRTQPAPQALELGKALAHAIATRQPGSRPAQQPQEHAEKWAVHFDRLYRLDKRSWERQREVLDWSQQDPFWQTNILSGKKFREKFDVLEAQMGRQAGGGKARLPANRGRAVPASRDAFEELPDKEELK